MSRDFVVIAIIAAYNEADIIETVVRDLINQQIQVYFLDDGSTDGTVQAIQPFVGRGILQIERLAGVEDHSGTFSWERILRRKAQLARELDANWFIHHDADEFRDSPWAGLSLTEAIRRVDALGYNAIDFANLDFWPVHDAFRPGTDVCKAFTRYSEGAPYNRVQIRGWRKTAHVDLASSGGHEARFEGRRVFPIRFISRHYPIRGQSHGERKVFAERQRRFLDDERDRGWHVQYDDTVAGASFIRNPASLTPYDADDVRITLSLRHRGVEELEQALATVRADAEAHCREAEHRRQGLEQSLAIARADAEASRCEAEKRTRALEGSTEALVRAGDELRQRAAQIEALRSCLEQRALELGAARTQAVAHLAELEAVRTEMRERAAALDRRTIEFGETRAALVAASATVGTCQNEVALLRQTVDQHVAEIERYRAVATDGLRRLDEVHRSRSWRWMAPARTACRLLTGR